MAVYSLWLPEWGVVGVTDAVLQTFDVSIDVIMQILPGFYVLYLPTLVPKF